MSVCIVACGEKPYYRGTSRNPHRAEHVWKPQMQRAAMPTGASFMEIYLIRHAEAVALGENNVNADEDRPLTPAGETQSKAIATGLQRKGVAFQLILTSPLLRARQTV